MFRFYRAIALPELQIALCLIGMYLHHIHGIKKNYLRTGPDFDFISIRFSFFIKLKIFLRSQYQ